MAEYPLLFWVKEYYQVMRNKLIGFIALLAFIPCVVSAAWWNPVSWFDSWAFLFGKHDTAIQQEVVVSSNLEPVLKEQINPTDSNTEVANENVIPQTVLNLEQTIKSETATLPVISPEQKVEATEQPIKKDEVVKEEQEEIVSDECMYKDFLVSSNKTTFQERKLVVGGLTKYEPAFISFSITSNCNLYGEKITYNYKFNGNLMSGPLYSTFTTEKDTDASLKIYNGVLIAPYTDSPGVYTYNFIFKNQTRSVEIERK